MWYWCCQDQGRRQKAWPSQRKGTLHRDMLGMDQYSCKSKLNISYCTNMKSSRKSYTISIWLKHHMKHTLYYDVSIPPDAAALICKNLDCLCQNEVGKKVLMAYLSVTAKQVHAAWTAMSETLWKQGRDQSASVKAHLEELQDNTATLDLPEIEVVKQIMWVMREVVHVLLRKIVKVRIDATCKIYLHIRNECANI